MGTLRRLFFAGRRQEHGQPLHLDASQQIFARDPVSVSGPVTPAVPLVKAEGVGCCPARGAWASSSWRPSVKATLTRLWVMETKGSLLVSRHCGQVAGFGPTLAWTVDQASRTVRQRLFAASPLDMWSWADSLGSEQSPVSSSRKAVGAAQRGGQAHAGLHVMAKPQTLRLPTLVRCPGGTMLVGYLLMSFSFQQCK